MGAANNVVSRGVDRKKRRNDDTCNKLATARKKMENRIKERHPQVWCNNFRRAQERAKESQITKPKPQYDE